MQRGRLPGTRWRAITLALGQEEEVRERIKVRDGVGLLLNRGVVRNCVLVPLDPATRKVIGFD